MISFAWSAVRKTELEREFVAGFKESKEMLLRKKKKIKMEGKIWSKESSKRFYLLWH